MTLKEHYSKLDFRPRAPRAELIGLIMAETEKSYATVMRWVRGKSVPEDANDRKIISNLTGLSEEDLFPTLKTNSNGND